eukprot:CAMPEP_0206367550 /NCGR_PEP_ID=MMETSP0294-20121207/4122_1 /ASSEMBLY_ACC=CAM_ASM_000327 /TAXON_ID=39354 /ORGANISM="Heterosigma akashiwo, Strain CCMP2393" /LENGTH=344 /DNA_ID=CAMNT_0053813843 /DNA_START=320 /DNA_END=1351 /DNA_ORIENTATION=+
MLLFCQIRWGHQPLSAESNDIEVVVQGIAEFILVVTSFALTTRSVGSNSKYETQGSLQKQSSWQGRDCSSLGVDGQPRPKKESLITKEKASYIAQVAHDFGTPLTTFSLTVESLRLTGLSREQCEHIETLESALELMTVARLSALDMDRHARGLPAVPALGPTDLRATLARCARVLLGYAGRADARCLAPNVATVVQLDGDWLWGMIINLLSNAKKFTVDGPIVVTVFLAPEYDDEEPGTEIFPQLEDEECVADALQQHESQNAGSHDDLNDVSGASRELLAFHKEEEVADQEDSLVKSSRRSTHPSGQELRYRLRVEVADRGEGVAPGREEAIFQPFQGSQDE